jgi:hypothetical protein
VFERFNSLTSDYGSLFAGFISLFARLGNLLPAMAKHQLLGGRAVGRRRGVNWRFRSIFP